MPGDLLDAFARLMDIFLPGDVKKFEALSFDLRVDDPSILEAIIQGGLVCRSDPLAAKNAFYLLNRIVSFSKISSNDQLFGVPLRVWEQFVICYATVQESQVHLLLPLLPVLKSILVKQELPMAWWRVLFVKGLGNDSIPCRRVLLHAVLSVDARECAALCCPDGLDFCLDDLLRWGVDPNSGFLVTPQVLTSDDDRVVDLGEMVAVFFANLIEAYSRMSPGHGRAIVKELLAAIEEILRVPVGLIFVLKAFKQTSTSFPALDNTSLDSLARLAVLPSLHNQRARLLVKWQLCELLMAFADASAISFDQLCGTLNELVLESIQLRTLGEDSENFAKLATWMNSCFGAEYLREGVLIAFQQFFAPPPPLSSPLDDVRALKEKAQILATMCVFSLGSPDGRFVSFSRVIFEQLALVSMMTEEGDGTGAIPAFVMFLALNESVQAVLKGRNDLITQLGSTKKIFEWLSFLDDCLFGVKQTDLTACQVLLEAFSLLINRASDNDERQLMQLLDMLSFRLVSFIDDKSLKQKRDHEGDGEGAGYVDVGFTGLLTVFAAMTALSATLHKLADLGHVRESLLSGPMIQRLIRFKLERPGGLNEAQWDIWPTFVTLFTAAKWKCIEAMAVTMRPVQNDELSLLAILASCIQALEVSKYGGTLAILKCTGTLINLILKESSDGNSSTI